MADLGTIKSPVHDHAGELLMSKSATVELIEPSSWAAEPETVPAEGPGRTEDDLVAWRELRARLRAMAITRGWSKAEAARRSGTAEGTFSQWYSGKYIGRYDGVNKGIVAWLDSEEDTADLQAAIPVSPAFIKTKTSERLWDLMLAAKMLGGMTMASLAAGMGKTTTAEQFVATTPNTWLISVDEPINRPLTMLQKIAEGVGAKVTGSGLMAAIGRVVAYRGSGTLIIIDEAQDLSDEAINQARKIMDRYKCGICLLGNDETNTRFRSWIGLEKHAQIRRRVLKRYQRRTPDKADLAAFIKAWGIEDDAMAKYLMAVGMKPGALGQIDQTMRLAKLMVAGSEKDLNLALLKKAWEGRNVDQ